MSSTKKPEDVAIVKEFVAGPRLGMSARNLYREIFRADSPEETVRALPAQSVYLAIRSVGLESSTELLPLISDEQYKVVLDFDLWKGETFSEAHFWNWLQVLDQEPGREALEGFLHTIDARLLGIIIARHVEVEFSEEPTEGPLAPGYYTPDKGSTWLRINLTDPEQHRRLGKLLALTYEGEPELFYQLLAEAGYVTELELEESAFQDKSRRLWDEGMPDQETSYRLNVPVPLKKLESGDPSVPEAEREQTVLPLAFSLSNLQPLNNFLGELAPAHRAAIEAELALIANAGVVHYEVDITEPAELSFLIEKIRGAMNIGLEVLDGKRAGLGKEIYEKFGLQRLYQLGLYELAELRIAAQGANIPEADSRPMLQQLKEAAEEKFPVAPRYLLPDGSIEPQTAGDSAAPERRAFTYRRQLEAAKSLLRERCAQ